MSLAAIYYHCLPGEFQMITDNNSFQKKLKAHFYNQAFSVASLGGDTLQGRGWHPKKTVMNKNGRHVFEKK